ncbi:MAG TPA: spore coat U domain-containing protein [Thermoanaerobaculia bacterium]|nr:spore coat U domain-containing protein [Thermoanaerobaculia bacterium]
MKRTILSLIALTAIVSAAPLFAAQQTANLNVTASVSAVCQITTTAVAFGAYDPVVVNAATDLTAAGSVNVACTKGTPATIDLGTGANFSAGSRRMSSGTDFLGYALYKDAARTQVWGTGLTGGSTAAYTSASKASASVPVYGTVPQAQDVTVGSYSDTVVATINY